jgi:hypothetical protein
MTEVTVCPVTAGEWCDMPLLWGIPAGSEAGQRQVTHLVPGQTEPDTVAEAGHRADRDGYPPLAPEVTLVEQNVSHMMPAGKDGQPPDLPDGAVRGMHMLPGADFHFACGDAIRGDAPGSCTRAQARAKRHSQSHAPRP